MGGGPSRPAPEPKPEPEATPEPQPGEQKSTRESRRDAAALRARRRRGGLRSLLSPTREEAASGLSDKLGG